MAINGSFYDYAKFDCGMNIFRETETFLNSFFVYFWVILYCFKNVYQKYLFITFRKCFFLMSVI